MSASEATQPVEPTAWGRFLDAASRGAVPPRLQRVLWRGWYHLLTRGWQDAAWTFMNYGYLPGTDEPSPVLAPSDEPQRCFIGLYHHLLHDLDLSGKRVLEVGSGRGGGAAWIARTSGAASVVGVDFSATTVQFAQRIHAGVDRLQFMTGDAEQLPLPDASIDVVVNVESSHCYANVSRFVDEVERVLVPNGYFCWADLCAPGRVAEFDRVFDRPTLRLVRERALGPGVIRALDAMEQVKADRLRGVRVGRSVMRQFAGMPNSVTYTGIRAGDIPYRSRVMQYVPAATR